MTPKKAQVQIKVQCEQCRRYVDSLVKCKSIHGTPRTIEVCKKCQSTYCFPEAST